jgi:hypothetical protein
MDGTNKNLTKYKKILPYYGLDLASSCNHVWSLNFESKKTNHANPHHQGPSTKKQEDKAEELASVVKRAKASQLRGADGVDRKDPSGECCDCVGG